MHYPRLEIRAPIATRKTCPDRACEPRFLAQLSPMTQTEIPSDVFIPDDDEMLLKARE